MLKPLVFLCDLEPTMLAIYWQGVNMSPWPASKTCEVHVHMKEGTSFESGAEWRVYIR